VALWIQSTGLGNEIWALDLALALRDPEGHNYSASSSLLDKELLYVDEKYCAADRECNGPNRRCSCLSDTVCHIVIVGSGCIIDMSQSCTQLWNQRIKKSGGQSKVSLAHRHMRISQSLRLEMIMRSVKKLGYPV